MIEHRDACTLAIVASNARHKLVVAGPGTGKTYTFGELLRHRPGPSLVLTLINNLVADMRPRLADHADVRTFHSFSLGTLHEIAVDGLSPRFHSFPRLAEIIEADSAILYQVGAIARAFTSMALEDSFRLLNDAEPSLGFFLDRANYYDAVGFDDTVYRVVLHFRNHPDAIPCFENLLVDEYQDFNQLEVALITQLEGTSPSLIVGDDDQAIYDFRHASPAYLRAKAQDPAYEQFPLPYCSRCTDPIINAVESVISSAQAIGLLPDRLNKDFVCYTPDKATDNATYPSIQMVTCSTHNTRVPYISRYIESVISALPPEETAQAVRGEYPLALIVGPSHYLAQINEYLTGRLPNVTYSPRRVPPLTLLDGFRLILERPDSNLAWRVILEALAPHELPRLVSRAFGSSEPLADLVTPAFRRTQFLRRAVLQQLLADGDQVSPAHTSDLEAVFEIPLAEIRAALRQARRQAALEQLVQAGDQQEYIPRILLTTYSGCKGLDAGFTFIVGLEEGVFPKRNDQPTSTEVCQLIVALTRTRKQSHLLHANMFAGKWTRPSAFLGWMPADICSPVNVNKDYF